MPKEPRHPEQPTAPTNYRLNNLTCRVINLCVNNLFNDSTLNAI